MLEDRNTSLVGPGQRRSSESLQDVDLETQLGGETRPSEASVKEGYMEQGDVLMVETPWYMRLYRHRSCLCVSLIVFTFFLWGVTSTNKACWAKMSPPHVAKRNFNSKTFLAHISDDSSTSAVSRAVVGKEKNADKEEIRFLIVGNTGRDGFCYQTDTAYEMTKAARTMKAAFIISTGNVFFPSGIASADDAQINTSWRDVYNSPYLSSINWYTAMGEAEKLGDLNALLEFSRNEKRFVIEGPYYEKMFFAPNKATSLHAFFLDTSALIRSKKQKNDEQLIWLSEGLASSNATIKIVVGFHTPFKDIFLRDFLVPILEDEHLGVTAYFSGRERSLQWYKGKSTHYLISGAGAEMLKNENPFPDPIYVAPTSGFLACSLGRSEKKSDEWRLKIAFVSSVGDVLKVMDTTHY